MNVNEKSIREGIKLLNAYAINDSKMDYRIILGLVFTKNKSATKKKLKAEEVLLADLSKQTVFYPHTFGNAPVIALFTLKNLVGIEGIDHIGSENLIKDIQTNHLSPNYLLCFKDEMPALSKYSRVLGPKGLMPTPKQGTVVEEDTIKKVIEDLKKGSLKIKVNKYLMSQVPVGTVHMNNDFLVENINYILSFIKSSLPIPFLKSNLQNVYLTCMHAPSVKINIFAE